MSKLFLLVSMIAAIVLMRAPAGAEAPFQIEDPSTLNPGRWETFTLFELDRDADGSTKALPGLEIHAGLARRLLLHMDVPVARVDAGGMHSAGVGDLGVALKYKFLDGGARGWQAAIYPHVTLPTGDASRGLGNGKPSWAVPIWFQHDIGNWTICVGGGENFNSAENGTASPFGGILLHTQLTKRLLVGFEVFAQGRTTLDSSSSTIGNVGTSMYITKNFGLLARAGRAIGGRPQSNFYVALYNAWGPSGE